MSGIVKPNTSYWVLISKINNKTRLCAVFIFCFRPTRTTMSIQNRLRIAKANKAAYTHWNETKITVLGKQSFISSLRGSQWPSCQTWITLRLTLGEWSRLLVNVLQLAVGHPNSSWRKKLSWDLQWGVFNAKIIKKALTLLLLTSRGYSKF